MIASLCLRLNGLRKLASEGNNNAIGLLNEIYKDIVSSKLQQEVIKTKYDKSNGKLSYRHVDIMVQNNSFALCREFSNTVFGNFNKFYQTFIANCGENQNGEQHGMEAWHDEYRHTSHLRRTAPDLGGERLQAEGEPLRTTATGCLHRTAERRATL